MPILVQDRLTLPLSPRSDLLIQDKRHARDMYARLILSDEQKRHVCFTKVTDNSAISDFRPDPKVPWQVTYTASDRVNMINEDGNFVHVNTEDEAGGISANAGVIMVFHGTAAATVARDIFGAVPKIISLQEAELQEAATDVHYPRATLWEFRIHEVIYTDGPDRNSRLQEAAEEQRARQEEKTLRSQEEFYSRMLAMLAQIGVQISKSGGQVDMPGLLAGAKEAGVPVPDPANLTEDQKAAMEEWTKIDEEPKPQEAATVAPTFSIASVPASETTEEEAVRRRVGRPRKI